MDNLYFKGTEQIKGVIRLRCILGSRRIWSSCLIVRLAQLVLLKQVFYFLWNTWIILYEKETGPCCIRNWWAVLNCVINLTVVDLQTGHLNKISQHLSGGSSYCSLLPVNLLCLPDMCSATTDYVASARCPHHNNTGMEGYQVSAATGPPCDRNTDKTPTAARPHMPGPAGVKNVKHAFTLSCEEKS